MAYDTWQQLSGGRYSGAQAVDYTKPGNLLTGAIKNITGAFDNRNKRLKKRDTAIDMNRLAQMQTLEQYNNNIDTFNAAPIGEYTDQVALDAAKTALLPSLQTKANTEEARLLGLENTAYTLERNKAADVRADVERNKLKNINASVGNILSANQATEDSNQQAYTAGAANSNYVSVQNGVPVYADLSTLPVEEQEQAKSEQALIRSNFLKDTRLKGTLSTKALVKELTITLRDMGATSTQIANKVANLKGQEKERRSLSEEGQAIVAEQSASITSIVTAAKEAAADQKNQVLADNPITHTLNAEGTAIKYTDVYEKARSQYPSSSILAGAGGDALTKMIGTLDTSGITIDGSYGTKTGSKYAADTRPVAPWMLSKGMDIAGQTADDSWGNATIAKQEFRKIIAKLAFDPTYAEYEANNRDAKAKFRKDMLTIDMDASKQLTALTVAQRNAEGGIDRAASRNYISGKTATSTVTTKQVASLRTAAQTKPKPKSITKPTATPIINKAVKGILDNSIATKRETAKIAKGIAAGSLKLGNSAAVDLTLSKTEVIQLGRKAYKPAKGAEYSFRRRAAYLTKLVKAKAAFDKVTREKRLKAADDAESLKISASFASRSRARSRTGTQ